MQLATWLLPTNILNQNLHIERSLFESFCVSNDVIHWLALLWCGCRPIMFATFHIDSIPFNQFRVNTMKQIAETSVSGLVVNLISNNKNIIWRLGLPCSISFCYLKVMFFTLSNVWQDVVFFSFRGMDFDKKDQVFFSSSEFCIKSIPYRHNL